MPHTSRGPLTCLTQAEAAPAQQVWVPDNTHHPQMTSTYK